MLIRKKVEINGYSDAGRKAYGYCIYLRAIYAYGRVICRLVCATSRVVPLRVVSFPRLELCGCVLLAQLAQCIQ